MQRVTHWTLVD